MYYLDSMPARDLPPCPQMGGGHVSLRGCGCTPTYQPPSLSVWPPTGALCVAAYCTAIAAIGIGQRTDNIRPPNL